MALNPTIFQKPQRDQLKNIGGGADIEKRLDDLDARMLNYTGDWVSDNEYHEHDVVTWGSDGHLYEVIKAHTSSASFDPDNPEYYKAMTSTKYAHYKIVLDPKNLAGWRQLNEILARRRNGKMVYGIDVDDCIIHFPENTTDTDYKFYKVHIGDSTDAPFEIEYYAKFHDVSYKTQIAVGDDGNINVTHNDYYFFDEGVDIYEEL